jgi:hypothetical protein
MMSYELDGHVSRLGVDFFANNLLLLSSLSRFNGVYRISGCPDIALFKSIKKQNKLLS